jgi:hypothetical protein
MNGIGEPAVLAPEVLKRTLSSQLFPQEEGINTYTVLDGAAIPDLLDHLYADARPDFVCLYRGDLEPDMAEVAPYLARLDPAHPFTDWLLPEGWGKHWGIFALARGDLKAVRKHFRTFLVVKDPDGKQLYFRFYDPRALRLYLPTCNGAEAKILFGPLDRYFCEGAAVGTLLSFHLNEGCASMTATQLA